MDTTLPHRLHQADGRFKVDAAGLEAYRQPLAVLLRRLTEERLVERLWRRDPSLWYPAAETQARIRERLGWLDLPAAPAPQFQEWLKLVQAQHATDVLYVGVGDAGSVARLWRDLAPDAPESPTFTLLDTTDPAIVRATLDAVVWERTAVIVAETDRAPDQEALVRLVSSAYAHAAPAALPLAVLAPPTSTLVQSLQLDRLPALLPLPPDVGGRFGALSPLGLAPAALLGWDVARLSGAARDLWVTCQRSDDLAANPGVWLGTVLAVLAQQGRDQLMLLTPAALQPLARWIIAFVSGSLSKHARGFVMGMEEQRTENREPGERTKNKEQRTKRTEGGPRTKNGELSEERRAGSGEPRTDVIGANEGLDQGLSIEYQALGTRRGSSAGKRVWVELRLAGVTDAALDARSAALRAADQPMITVELADVYAVAAQIVWWQVAVATAAVVLGLNPFDEPDTAARHAYLWRRLSQPEAQLLPPPTLIDAAALRGSLPMIRSSECLIIAAYLPSGPAIEERLHALRALLHWRFGVATVVVDPLRELAYATQLLHAGRPCAVLLLTAEVPQIVAVPGVDWTLNDLRQARIAADVTAWTRMERPFIHIALGPDPAQDLRRCIELIEQMGRA